MGQLLLLQEEAARLMEASPPDPDASIRRDLTHMQVWAIDSADTTEVDDAVSVELSADGCHCFWVHIADPTRWLAMGTALDQEAARRTSTLYLPTGKVPVKFHCWKQPLCCCLAALACCGSIACAAFSVSGILN